MASKYLKSDIAKTSTRNIFRGQDVPGVYDRGRNVLQPDKIGHKK